MQSRGRGRGIGRGIGRGGLRGGFRGGDRGGLRGGFRGGDRGGFRGVRRLLDEQSEPQHIRTKHFSDDIFDDAIEDSNNLVLQDTQQKQQIQDSNDKDLRNMGMTTAMLSFGLLVLFTLYRLLKHFFNKTQKQYLRLGPKQDQEVLDKVNES
eukprot:403355083